MPNETDSSTTGAQQSADQQGQTSGGTSEPTWDAWLSALPEDQRTQVSKLYDAKTSGLKSALDKERETRAEHEKQIRELAGKAQKGSDDERRLTGMADELAKANRRADFYEQAVRPEIGLNDVVAAYALVQAMPDDYVDRRGNINFTLLKERHPGLFRSTAASANAGAGAGQAGSGGSINQRVNNAIRHASGRR